MNEIEGADWDVRGLVIGVPHEGDMDAFKQMITDVLPDYGCNTMVLLIRYRYAFESHPEVADPGPLTPDQARTLTDLCEENGIRLIPKMNLLGHQSGKERGSELGLLRAHPEFDETPDLASVRYCRSLCPNHPEVKGVVFDLIDELLDAFGTGAIHVGLDEVFEIGHCPRCQGIPNAVLFADWVKALHGHISGERGAEMWMWGDRLLNAETMGYGEWESSENDTWQRIDEIPRDDLVICDWHYEERDDYPSVPYFARKDFDLVVCPWKNVDAARMFLDYTKEQSLDEVLGVLQTSWCDAGDLARYLLGDETIEGTPKMVGESFKLAMKYAQ